MTLPRRVLYVWQAPYPWDIRVEKIAVALRRHGCEVEVLARRGVGEPRTADLGGIAIHRVGPEHPRLASLPLPGNPVWRRALQARMRMFRPDLLIARDIPVAGFAAQAARAARVPWVIDMAEHYPEAMRSWKKYTSNPLLRLLVGPFRLPDRIERRAVLKADGVMPVCEEQKLRLVREYGILAARVEPVLNTPKRAQFASMPSHDPRQHAWRFGYHGIVAQDRDLLTVVRGFDIAAAKNLAITLTIAGDGESMSDLRTEVERLPSRARITLSGAFARADVDRLYAETDIGIVSWAVNPFTETTIANKFFDYAACGRPFVFTATQPMLHLMETMRCGIPYRGGDPEDLARAMLQIVEADYAALAANGRRSIDEKFHWEKDVARMMAFLERVMELHAGK